MSPHRAVLVTGARWLSPLRGDDDPEAEWRLLTERRRILHAELADLEVIMAGVAARRSQLSAQPEPSGGSDVTLNQATKGPSL